MKENPRIDITHENLSEYPGIENAADAAPRTHDGRYHILKGLAMAIIFVIIFLVFLSLLTVLIWWIA